MSKSTRVQVHHSDLVDFSVPNIRFLADHEGATFIGQYAWTEDQCWTMFYTETPREKDFHNLFAFRKWFDPVRNDASMRVIGLDDRTPLRCPGLFLPSDNAFVYSRYTHDYFSTPFGFAVDGGRDYLRIVGSTPADAVNATFNPLTLEVKTDDDQLFAAEYASDNCRSLRGEKTWERNGGPRAD